MQVKPTGRMIADALGISEGRVSQLKRDGMPVGDIEAACAWYRRRVDPARAFGQRHRVGRKAPVHAPVAADPLERLAVLAVRADRLIEAGQPIDPLEDELRSALADVPEAEHGRVELPKEVWDFLCAEVLAIALEYEDGSEDAEPADEEAQRELSWFWFNVAAGFIRPVS